MRRVSSVLQLWSTDGLYGMFLLLLMVGKIGWVVSKGGHAEIDAQFFLGLSRLFVTFFLMGLWVFVDMVLFKIVKID